MRHQKKMLFSSVSVNNFYLSSLFIEIRTMTALEKMHRQSDQQQISCCLRLSLPAIIDQAFQSLMPLVLPEQLQLEFTERRSKKTLLERWP